MRSSKPPELFYTNPGDCYATIRPDEQSGWFVTLHTGPTMSTLTRWTFTKNGARSAARRALHRHRRHMQRRELPGETIR